MSIQQQQQSVWVKLTNKCWVKKVRHTKSMLDSISRKIKKRQKQ